MSKKDDIIKYVEEHPGCTTFECKEAIDCSLNYIRRIFKEINYKAPIVSPTRRKYIEGTIIGENGVFFKQRLDNDNGLFICPYDNKEFVGSISGVGRGLIKSCGCLHSRQARENTFIDLTGQRFGKLTVQYCLPYTNKENRTIWHCKCDCGGEKDVVGKLLIDGHVHSCGCSNSKGEVAIRNILKNKNITYEEQKSFDDCVNSETNAKLKFDFYLPLYNAIIEYDGIQHFKVFGWNTENLLRQNQYRDNVKNQYCIDHEISLYRISYLEYDNIDNRMEEILKELNNGKV